MEPNSDFDLERYGLGLWRRKWLIVLTVVVATGAAILATRLGSDANADSDAAAISEIHRASITVKVEGAASLPNNPALSLLGIGDVGNRGLATHVQLMRSRNVLERAAEKLRSDPDFAVEGSLVIPEAASGQDQDQDEPASPLSIASELELEIDVLESEVTVRALQNTDLIEVVARASDPILAKRRAEAMIEAYQDFLVDDEFGAIRDALETVKQRIDEIELSTIVTPEVLTLLAILSREMDGIGRAVDSGAEDLLVLQIDISAAVRDSIGAAGEDAVGPGSLSSAERALEILRATADSIRFASSEIDVVFEVLSKAEFDAVLSEQVSTLVSAAIALDSVSEQIGEVQGQIAELDNEIAEANVDEALAENIGHFESANTELGLTPGLIGQVVVDVGSLLPALTDDVDRLTREINLLKAEVDRQARALDPQTEELDQQIKEVGQQIQSVGQQIQAVETVVARMETLEEAVQSVILRFETVIQTATLAANSDSTRQLVIDEARAAGSSLAVIANEFVVLRRGENMTVAGQGYLIAAESRLRTAVSALDTIIDSGLRSQGTLGTGRLLQIVQQLTAVSEASDAVVLEVERSVAAGSAGIAEQDLLTQHMQATSSTLRGVSAVVRNVRVGQLDGSIFAQLVSAEAQINAITESLEDSTQTAFGAETVGGQLGTLRGELAGALTITDQLLARSETAIGAGDTGVETQRLMANQIEAGAGVLLSAADDLEDVRKLDVSGTNAGGLISLEARLRGLSDGLLALAQISSARDRLATISLTAQDAAQLIRTVDGDTELEDARDAVGEIGVRLTVASTSLAVASSEIQQLTDREAQSGDGNLALVSQRIKSAGTRLSSLTGRLPQIEGGTTADSESLLTLRGELEILLLRPQDTSFTTIGSTVTLLPTGALLNLGGEGADLTFVLGAVAGLFIGIIGAITLEYTDRSVKGPNDVKGIKGLVPLGVVAYGAAKGNPHPPEVIDKPGSIFSESVQLLMNSIEEKLGEETKVVVVASPRAGEGKTMLAINLARTFELRSKSVLLIDANLRKPDASKIMKVLDNDGLANVLASGVDAGGLVVRAEGVNILPAGSSEIMPVELVSRSEMGAMLRQFEQHYDVVVVDGPPILGFSDATALAKQTGTAVIVVRAGKSKRADIEEAHAMFSDAGVKVIGAVVNFVKPKTLKHLAHDKYNRPGRALSWLPRMPFNRN